MMLKFRKISRYWSARLRPTSCPPLFWHIGTPNFGDDINPAFFEALAGDRLRFATNRQAPHFLGMGSILGSATPASVVLGAGLLKPSQNATPGHVVALRGHLSRRALSITEDIPLGDPMVLADRLITPEGGDDIGLVPHVQLFARLRKRGLPGFRLIDASRNPWTVLREIGRCRIVLSQSLHGLIAADAFEIPNIWLAPAREMVGGRFKFDDYFSTLDAPKTPHEITPDLLAAPPLEQASVGQFRGHKAEYHALICATIKEGLQAWH
ncbi:MAG: polysaccharide pyruvyl transferase family protein [Roseovarius sp.]|nr:polysaccharide pyruvyl transferase family protein [Roseovarius sp.]